MTIIKNIGEAPRLSVPSAQTALTWLRACMNFIFVLFPWTVSLEL